MEGTTGTEAYSELGIAPHHGHGTAAKRCRPRCDLPMAWHEAVETTSVYLHADLRLKQAAMAKTSPTQEPPERFCLDDHVLAFLDSLRLFRATCRTKHEARPALAINSEYSGTRKLRYAELGIGFNPCCYLHKSPRLLPPGATVAGRALHPLGISAFPRRT